MGSLIGLVVLVLDVVAAVSLLSSGAATRTKLLWLLAIVLLPLVGMLLYFAAGPGRRRRAA